MLHIHLDSREIGDHGRSKENVDDIFLRRVKQLCNEFQDDVI